MKSKPSKKRLKKKCTIDRISDLPDSILGKILSYLPIKEVIATSILSTRWKPLFPTHVPLNELVLEDSYRDNDSDTSSYSDTLYDSNNISSDSDTSSVNFVDFVDKLLNVAFRDVLSLAKVVLEFKKVYGDAKIVSWIRSALGPNVEHLRLMSRVRCSVPLFGSLNGCTALVKLELGYNFQLELPEEFSLPNLKRLSLHVITVREAMDLQILIDGCPVLNELSITGCCLTSLDYLHIQHPFITKLVIEDCIDVMGDGADNIVIDATNLETLVHKHKGHYVSKYVCHNAMSNCSVCIDFVCWDHKWESDSQALCLAVLVKARSRTTHLSLYGDSLMALNNWRAPLPIFHNLTCVVLGRMGNHGWRMLARILKSAPNLAKLTFEEELEFTGAYTDFKSLLPSVPICLQLRIKKIEIWKFKWTPEEIKLIEYFLKNGRKLEELIVHCQPRENTGHLEVSSIRRMMEWGDSALVMGGGFKLKWITRECLLIKCGDNSTIS